MRGVRGPLIRAGRAGQPECRGIIATRSTIPLGCRGRGRTRPSTLPGDRSPPIPVPSGPGARGHGRGPTSEPSGLCRCRAVPGGRASAEPRRRGERSRNVSIPQRVRPAAGTDASRYERWRC